MKFSELTPEEKLVCAVLGKPAWLEGVKHFLSDEGQKAVNTLLDEFVAHAKAQTNQFGACPGKLISHLKPFTYSKSTERGVRVLRLRFGFEPLTDAEKMKHPGTSSRTYDEVATYFGVTRERVRQIATKTLQRLRHPIYNRKLRQYCEGKVDGV